MKKVTGMKIDPKDNHEVTPVPVESVDPFDAAYLRMSQDFDEDLGVKKELRAISITKPSKEAWIRTHHDPGFHMETYVIELKDDREIYLVSPELRIQVRDESTFSPRAFFTTITRQGVVFLWPIRLPGREGKLDAWNKSALDAADYAKTKWIRVSSNLNAGRYEFVTSTAEIPEPNWPDKSFNELLKLAFQDFYIDTIDHHVLKRLRGET